MSAPNAVPQDRNDVFSRQPNPRNSIGHHTILAALAGDARSNSSSPVVTTHNATIANRRFILSPSVPPRPTTGVQPERIEDGRRWSPGQGSSPAVDR
jgi:hypothetical protein